MTPTPQPLPTWDTPPADLREACDRVLTILRIPGAWTQGWFGRGANGSICAAESDDCLCCCLIGAVQRAHAADSFLVHLGLALGRSVSISGFNDAPGRTVDEVIALVERVREAK